MLKNFKNICYYTTGIFLGGIISTLVYYKLIKKDKNIKNIEKTDFYHLIHGNIRFIQKLQNLTIPSIKYSEQNPQKILILATPSLIDVVNPEIIFDLSPQHIITNRIELSNKNIQQIEEILETHQIKTVVVLGLEVNDNSDINDVNIRDQLRELLNTSQYIHQSVENNKIKPYWATYNTSTGYVRFHHHNY